MELFRIEHNAATGEVKEVSLTAAEITQKQKDEADYQQRKAAELEKITQREALLTKLGITEDEAKLLKL